MTLEKYNGMLRLIQDDKLHRLDDEMSVLNIFELAGLKNQEIRHSTFLSELLNPNSLLNIGDTVLKMLIRDAFKSTSSDVVNTLTAIDFELSNFDDFEVRREYRNIDLLLVNHGNEKCKYCICIENKVDSSESKEQLAKYRAIVENDFPDFKKLYLFLSPEGVEAEYDSDWISVSYLPVKQGIEKVLKNSALNNDVRLLLSHYLALLEKYVLGQKELQELAREIYTKHKEALDYIYENKPDKVSELSGMFQEWLSTKVNLWNLTLLPSSKVYTRMVNQEMRDLAVIIPGNGWQTNDIINIEIVTQNNSVSLKIVLGQSEHAQQRRAFLDFLQNTHNIKSNSPKFSTVWSQNLYRGDLDEGPIELVFDKVVAKLEHEIPKKSNWVSSIINDYLHQTV